MYLRITDIPQRGTGCSNILSGFVLWGGRGDCAIWIPGEVLGILNARVGAGGSRIPDWWLEKFRVSAGWQGVEGGGRCLTRTFATQRTCSALL